MLIYTALIIPIVAILAMFLFFRERLHWSEAVGTLLVPLFLIFCLKALAIYNGTRDTEWYGGYVVHATYYEDWNEYIHKTCSSTTCSGSGKNQTCTTSYYDCSYVDYHPEYWSLANNLGHEFYINEGKYAELVGRWQNRNFIDMRRSYYTNDGDAYRTVFNGDFARLEPTTEEGTYENRVAVSKSVFNFRDIEPVGLFEYPKVSGYNQKCLLGIENRELDLHLQKLNGLLGAEKQVRVYVLVWKNQPLDKAFDQQQYWKNGNKNELIVNIGVNDVNHVTWAYVFSWTPSEQLKVDIKSYLENKQLNLEEFFNWLPEQVRAKWVRKEFKDFAYIAVEPSFVWVVVIWVVTLLITVGIFMFCMMNDLDCEDNYEYKNNRSYGYSRSWRNYSGVGFDTYTRFSKYLQRRNKSKNSSRS